VMVSAGTVVVLGRIWGGEPAADVPLQLITYEAQSVRAYC